MKKYLLFSLVSMIALSVVSGHANQERSAIAIEETPIVSRWTYVQPTLKILFGVVMLMQVRALPRKASSLAARLQDLASEADQLNGLLPQKNGEQLQSEHNNEQLNCQQSKSLDVVTGECVAGLLRREKASLMKAKEQIALSFFASLLFGLYMIVGGINDIKKLRDLRGKQQQENVAAEVPVPLSV